MVSSLTLQGLSDMVGLRGKESTKLQAITDFLEQFDGGITGSSFMIEVA